MNNNKLSTRELVELSLFAALIELSVQFFRIHVGPQFIHFGNALVVVAALLYGTRKGVLVAAVGLGIFDLLNGFAQVVWITVLESIVVIFIIHLIYEKLLKKNDKVENIVGVAIVAALTKIVLNLFKYTLIGMFGNLALNEAMSLALTKITGSIGTSIATVIAVPLLYPVFKKVRATISK